MTRQDNNMTNIIGVVYVDIGLNMVTDQTKYGL